MFSDLDKCEYYVEEQFKPSFHMIADDRRIAGITDA